jgi:hypothetical protein
MRDHICLSLAIGGCIVIEKPASKYMSLYFFFLCTHVSDSAGHVL